MLKRRDFRAPRKARCWWFFKRGDLVWFSCK